MQSRYEYLKLGLIGILFLLFSSPAYAQLDIFEKPKDRTPSSSNDNSGGGGFNFGPISVGGNQGQKEMQQGGSLYAAGNYAAASLKYYKVVSQMAGSRWHPTAEYQLGKCLYRMGLYHAALDYFTRIIQAGSAHKRFRSSLSWVILISRKLNNESMFLGKLTRFKPSDFPRKYRDELFYLLGKHYYKNLRLPRARRLKLAMRLLRQVSTRHPKFYARAQYIIAIIYDEAQDPNNAARAFRRSIASARRIKNKKMQKNIMELGVIGLARIHYAAKHFRSAIGYYRLIERNSRRWLDVLFERAWAHLQLGEFGYTLGLLHTLSSPYFKNEYFPEAGILKAISFFSRCRYHETKKIARQYQRRYKPLVETINAFLRANSNPLNMFKRLQQLKNQDETTGLDDDSSGQMFQRILKLVFKSKSIQLNYSYIAEITRELQVINQSHAAWRQSSLAAKLRSSLKRERMNKALLVGKLAQARLRKAKLEVQRLIGESLKILYETLNSEKEVLRRSSQQRGSFSMRTDKKIKRFYISVAAPDDYAYWPFQGEYWIDELGYYRYRLRSECHRL